MKPSENPLGSEPVSTLLRRFAVPSVIAMLVSALYNMVDQLFIGHSIGVLGIAATNVAFPLSMVCTSIGLLCGIGGAANFNLCMGRREPEHAKSYVGNAISMLAILGVILCVAVQLFLRPYLHSNHLHRLPVTDRHNRRLQPDPRGWQPEIFHAV